MELRTERLLLRGLQASDFADMVEIMGDAETMVAYNGPFTSEEIQRWLDNQIAMHMLEGIALLAVVLKATGEMIGQCGLTMQGWKEQRLLEVGYLFKKRFWHYGYATEAAKACQDYAFTKLKAPWVYSIIRDTNQASQNVALRNGMQIVDQAIKHYRGIDMPHYLFGIKNEVILEE